MAREWVRLTDDATLTSLALGGTAMPASPATIAEFPIRMAADTRRARVRRAVDRVLSRLTE